MTVSFRIRYTKLGGHVHVKVWSSEFGLDTTHGLNGTLVFRESEWPAFRAALLVGLRADRITGKFYNGDDNGDRGVVEFIEDATVTGSPLDMGGEAR